MAMDSYGAKLTRRDVTDLATASSQLRVVADTINSSGVKWAQATVSLLIAANNTVVRIQNKGAAAFRRYQEKHGPETPEETPPDDMPDSERALLYPAPPKKPEED